MENVKQSQQYKKTKCFTFSFKLGHQIIQIYDYTSYIAYYNNIINN